MSRRIANPGLARLCRKRGAQIGDLACIAKCSKRNILYYASGQKHLPRIERGLASVFGLSVSELRRQLKLKPEGDHDLCGRARAAPETPHHLARGARSHVADR